MEVGRDSSSFGKTIAQFDKAIDGVAARLSADYQKPFTTLAAVASRHLGQVPHICTNDYTKREGVILFTDHGLGHTARVLKNLMKLEPLLGTNVDEYEKFLLYSGGLVHDIGMFVRLVEGDVDEQRKYHGRLAEIVVENDSGSDPDLQGKLDPLDIWYIGTIARLHQTAEFKRFRKTSRDASVNPTDGTQPLQPRHLLSKTRQACLGSLVLLADALDIHKARSSDKIYDAFTRVLGPINPQSSAEWLINSLVENYDLNVDVTALPRVVSVKYHMSYQAASAAFELDVSDGREEATAQYFLTFLSRYLHDGHFCELGTALRNSELRVTVYSKGCPTVIVGRSAGRPSTRLRKQWRFWYEGLVSLSFGEKVRKALKEACGALGFETCFVMVMDELRCVLRIVVTKDFREVYGDYFWKLLTGAEQKAYRQKAKVGSFLTGSSGRRASLFVCRRSIAWLGRSGTAVCRSSLSLLWKSGGG